MNPVTAPLPMALMKFGGVGLVFLGIFLTVNSAVGDKDGLPHKYFARYTSSLERKLRLMFIFTPGRLIATVQICVIAGMFAVEFLLPDGLPYFVFWPLAAAVGPYVWIESQRVKRREAIELQLDGFMLALANSLKSIPSISAAFNSIVPILQPPIQQEVELATKEMKVGSSLDQALLHMAARINSRQVDSALSSILIGRQVGGNLAKVLETTAASIREMQRLDGVVRTKTAEGKMQLWVVGGLPMGIIIIMSLMVPGYFDPMQANLFGYMLSGIGAACWMAALVLARKILAVDI